MSDPLNVLAKNLAFPEGPAFGPDGGLWFVEAATGHVTCWVDDNLERYHVGGTPNGLAFDSEGELWMCDAGTNAIRTLDPETRTCRTVIGDDERTVLDWPNDLAFDGRGNLVFTCPGDPDNSPASADGSLYCLTRDRTLRTLRDDLVFPNGLAFVDGGDSLVVAETYNQRLVKGEWDSESASWHQTAPWSAVGGPVGPDGMAPDAYGRLYVAIYGQGVVRGVDPSGRVASDIDVPGANPTNVAFDPDDELGLVVTEAERGRLLSLSDLGPKAPSSPI